jgi:hypothetical protein
VTRLRGRWATLMIWCSVTRGRQSLAAEKE